MSRRPIPCWIDGRRSDSTTAAALELGVSPSKMLKILEVGEYDGQIVSRTPPVPAPARVIVYQPPERHVRLLSSECCLHRLGVYGWMRV